MQQLALQAAFKQATCILVKHMREGQPPRPYPRRRLIGKQTIQHVPPQGRPPAEPAVDLNLGMHTLQHVVYKGFASLQCNTCGMRARLQNANWLRDHPCGPAVKRRSELAKCPRGMMDLQARVGGSWAAVCIWCGAFDRQRTNLFRRHQCWHTLLGDAVRARHNTDEEHIEYLVGRAGGGHAGHDLYWDATHLRFVCIACGRITKNRRAKGSCGGMHLADWRVTPEEYRTALQESVALFFT